MKNRDTLLLATHNEHKATEIAAIFHANGLNITVKTLASLGDEQEIIEDGQSLRDNALIKAKEGYLRHGIPCFADDTGLEVDALGGAPGIYTARYAGPQCQPEDNIQKLLGELSGLPESKRSATFKTVIAFVVSDEEVHYFEGAVHGKIATEKCGEGGFGYDPIFIPDETGRTFSEMGEEEKNKISHRGRATSQLVEFLKHL